MNFNKLAEEANQEMPEFRHGTSILVKPNVDLESLESKKVNVKFSINNKDVIVKHKVDDKIFELFTNKKWNIEKKKLYHLHQKKVNYFVYLKIHKSIEEPIIIELDCDDNVFLSFFILAEKNTKSTIILNKKGINYSEDIRILAQKNSNLDVVFVDTLFEVNIQKISTLNKENSVINIINTCLNCKYKKTDIINTLQGNNSQANTSVLFHSKDDQIFDIYTAAFHEGKETTSNIITRGVVLDKSKALSRGLIKISKNATNSKGYEKQEALILSDEAEADAVPKLEIENSDVTCSHGSSITNIDKELLFYMTSRGITEEDVKRLIINGYFTPLVDKFNSLEKPIREAIGM